MEKGCEILEEKQVQKPHKLVVNNRKTSMVTGVLDVLSFDLNEILLETDKRKRFTREPSERGKRGSGSVRSHRQCYIFGCSAKCRTG